MWFLLCIRILFIPYVKWVIKVCVLCYMDNNDDDEIPHFVFMYLLHHLLKLNILKYITLCDQRTFSI